MTRLGYINEGINPLNSWLETVDPIFTIPPIVVESEWKPEGGFDNLVAARRRFLALLPADRFVPVPPARAVQRPTAAFSVPLYPLVPIIFCCSCAWMLYQSTELRGLACPVRHRRGPAGPAVLLAVAIALWPAQRGSVQYWHTGRPAPKPPPVEIIARENDHAVPRRYSLCADGLYSEPCAQSQCPARTNRCASRTSSTCRRRRRSSTRCWRWPTSGPGEIVYDLGCGDGRIPVTAAKKYGVKAWGFDINPVRVKESLENVEKTNVKNLVTIKLQDIFELDLSKADVITLYLLPQLNVKLIPQLDKLKPGCRIVSHDFNMEGVRPKKMLEFTPSGERMHKIYLWVTPLERM